MRPLIFSASIGHGHQQAAKALKHELEVQGYESDIIDTFHSFSPMLHKLILSSYLHILKTKPDLWRSIYVKAENRPYYLWLDRFAVFFVERLYSYIQHAKAPFIISTHPFVTAFLTTLKRKKSLDIPLYTVITDLVLHPVYYRKEIDGYFTSDTNLISFSKQHGLPIDRIYPTGIPVPNCHSISLSKWKVRYDLGLPHDCKIVLIAGGGIGLTNYVEVINKLQRLQKPLVVLCMTGHNNDAAEKLNSINSRHDIKVIEFTDKFLSYLRASDVIISKSGGLTMTEALLCETPILIYQPVPGHEEANADYLVEHGAALKADSSEQIPIYLKRILYNEHINQTIKHATKKLKRPNAANDIIGKILMSYDKQGQLAKSRKLSVYH